MKQKEIIDWAMLGVRYELSSKFLKKEKRAELERKYKELADLYILAIKNEGRE